MKIKFEIEKFKSELTDYNFKEESKLVNLFEHITDRLNEKNIFIENKHKENYKEIDFPEEIKIRILLVDSNEIFKHFFEEEIAEKTYGLFNISNGDGVLGESYIADEFIVLVNASINDFNKFYTNHKAYFLNKEDCLNRYLVTLTHEIQHALEFIENSGGLTPLEVENLFDDGVFDYDNYSCQTGYGLPDYFEEYEGITDEDEIYELTELRVEHKGRNMLEDLKISPELLSDFFKDNIKNKNKLKNT
jgi:hypothetical protein